MVYIEKFPRQLENNIDTLEFPLQHEEEEDEDKETESEDEHREASPAPCDAARDPVQSAQDNQLESTQDPPTPREAAGSSANSNPAQQAKAHAPMQPIPRQVDEASPSQLSTGTPPKTRKRTEYIMRESLIDLQTENSLRTNQSRQEHHAPDPQEHGKTTVPWAGQRSRPRQTKPRHKQNKGTCFGQCLRKQSE